MTHKADALRRYHSSCSNSTLFSSQSVPAFLSCYNLITIRFEVFSELGTHQSSSRQLFEIPTAFVVVENGLVLTLPRRRQPAVVVRKQATVVAEIDALEEEYSQARSC